MADDRVVGEVAALRSKGRFGKFVSVGFVGAVCDTAVLVALTAGAGLLPELATLAGIETAILVMFAINEQWTFAGEGATGRRSLFGRLKRSHVVRAGGSLTQFVVFVIVYRVFFFPIDLGQIGAFWVVVRALGLAGTGIAGFDLWLIVAKGVGIAVGLLVNYVAESLFTWRVTTGSP